MNPHAEPDRADRQGPGMANCAENPQDRQFSAAGGNAADKGEQDCDCPFGRQHLESIPAEALDAELVQGLPISFLRQHCVLPIKHQGRTVIAAGMPLQLAAVDDLRTLLREFDAPLCTAPGPVILAAIDQLFENAGHGEESLMDDLLEDDPAQDTMSLADLENVTGDLLDDASSAPIIRLVNHILAKAAKAKASDIHLEPHTGQLAVRFRLDGVLHTILELPMKLHPAVVSRIKVMSRLNIAEKRLPQDGRMEVRVGSRKIDLRVSCLPTVRGERVVLRLLEKNNELLMLSELGMAPDYLEHMRRLMGLSHGIVLVTGPTGSGKTTTLYAALSEINTPDRNILTIEDPVEYQLDGIGQMQVNSKIDLSFASGLRSMVRQDPDVILVGEIRDKETADIAIQAALTGHLVFSTLHTNDAPSAVTRLIDIGVEPFLVASAVRGIIAQRLVRVLCKSCKQMAPISERDARELRLEPGQTHMGGAAAGCEDCLNTGYRGRTSIYEFLAMSEAMQDLMATTSDANQIRRLARQEGMRSLREDGLRKVSEGRTSAEEILRVTLL